MMKLLLVFLIAIVPVLSAAPDSAESPPVTLSLPMAVQFLMEHNLELKVGEVREDIRRNQFDVEKSAFDAEQFAQLLYEDNKIRQNARNFTAIEQSILSVNPTATNFEEQNVRLKHGFRGLLPTGLQWETVLDLARMENSVNENDRFFHPEFESFYGVNLTQPLMKNRGCSANLAKMKMARIQVDIATREKEIQTINKVIEVVNNYYDLAFGQENLEVKNRAIESAMALLKENKERVRVGKMSPIDVSEAEVEVSKAKEEYFKAIDFLRQKKVSILKLISAETAGGKTLNFRVELAPQEKPDTLNLDALYQLAEENRPDMEAAKSRVDSAKTALDYANNQRKPDLNFALTAGIGTLDDDLGTSISNFFNESELRWSAGITFSQPLGANRAKAEQGIARSRLTEASISRDDVRHTLHLSVINSVHRIETLTERQSTAQTSVELAEKSVKLSEEMLKAGKGTTRMLLDAQNSLSDAKTRLLSARVDLQKSYAELWAVCGVLLEKLGFEVWRSKSYQ